MSTKEKWKLILIMWPSGAWKWTLIKKLKERRKDYVYPISATTREMRVGEKDWKDYYFLTEDEFKQKIADGEFLEHAKVHDGKTYYWLLISHTMNAINDWKTIIKEVDVQWFNSISKIIPKSQLKTIFILPPSEKSLRDRIRSRSPIDEDELDARMNTLKVEMEYADKADVTVKNVDNWIEDNIEVEKAIEEMYEDLTFKIEKLIK